MADTDNTIFMLEAVHNLRELCTKASNLLLEVAETPEQRQAAIVAAGAIQSQQQLLSSLLESYLELGEMFDELLAKSKELIATLK